MFSLVGRKRRRKDAEGREEGDASDAVEISANSEALQDGELREMSYANLLSSQSVSADHPHDHLGDDGDDDGDHRGDGRHRLGTYDPTFLDDPEMRTGKHRAVLNLQGCMFSLLNFVTEKQLKNDLNDQFWDKHDFWLQDRDISLSKIRKLKTLMVDVALDVSTTSPPVGFSQQQPMLEEETVATAIVYFEKLVLKVCSSLLAFFNCLCSPSTASVCPQAHTTGPPPPQRAKCQSRTESPSRPRASCWPSSSATRSARRPTR
jgi:hypothetical protein